MPASTPPTDDIAIASSRMTRLTLTRPDDWHLHLRDGAALAAVLAHTVARFARAIVMPNLAPPVTTTVAAADYRARIVARLLEHGHVRRPISAFRDHARG